MDSKELKNEIVSKAMENVMNAHQVPARQLLAALSRMEALMADYKKLDASSKSERDSHASQITELGTQIDCLTAIVDSYQQVSDAHADTIGGLLDEHSAQMDKMDATIASVKSMKPLKGDPGDSPTVDVDSIISQVTDALRSEVPAAIAPEPVDTDALYQTFVARLQKEMPIDVSHIRNGASFLYKTRSGKNIDIKNEELLHGGGTSSGPSSNSVYNEVVNGSGTAWVLGHTPVAGTVRLYGLGQKLLPTSGYTITGANITTVDSWPAGAISADYNF